MLTVNWKSKMERTCIFFFHNTVVPLSYIPFIGASQSLCPHAFKGCLLKLFTAVFLSCLLLGLVHIDIPFINVPLLPFDRVRKL